MSRHWTMRYRHRHNHPDGIIVRPEDRVDFSPASEILSKSGTSDESFAPIAIESFYRILYLIAGAALALMIVGNH